MGKEVLVIPEQHLKEVIDVILNGLRVTNCSDYVKDKLSNWCKDESSYLSRLRED